MRSESVRFSASLPSKGGAYIFAWREVVQRRIGRLGPQSRTQKNYGSNSLEDPRHFTHRSWVCRLTPQFSGRALPCDARRVCIMK